MGSLYVNGKGTMRAGVGKVRCRCPLRVTFLGLEPSCSFDGSCALGFGRLVDAFEADFESLQIFYVNSNATRTKSEIRTFV